MAITSGTIPSSSPPPSTLYVSNVNPIIIPINLRYNDANGDPVTSLFPLDYLTLVGQDLNNLVGTTNTTNVTVAIHTNQIAVLQNAVSTIPPAYNTPTISGQCLNSNTVQGIDVILGLLVSAWCSYTTITGSGSQLVNSISKQCPNLNSDTSFAGGQMAAITGWVSSPATLADSLTNLWLTVCDARTGIKDILTQLGNICPVTTATPLTTSSVGYTLLPYITTNVTYEVNLYLASGGTSLQTATYTNPSGLQTSSFTGLTTNTNYKIVVITTVIGNTPVTCNAIYVSTVSS